MSAQARGLSTGTPLLKNGSLNGMLTAEGLHKSSKDSGFSSRMSEAGADADERARHLLLGEHKGALTKRLNRISECQYEEPCACSPGGVAKAAAKILGVLCLLYMFICTLDLLSNAFRLLGGKTAGSVFSDSDLLRNPITGLMIGVLATVILQSSSTSSSIVITMVSSNIIEIQPAIPIIMGANIGTTVTNTLVSLAHSMDRREFRRAFSGAVVHDVFNWLTVLLLLPLEYCTGYLYHFTQIIVDSFNMEDMKAKKQDLLKKLTKPLTSRIIKVDKKVITGVAEGKPEYLNKTLLKVYCSYEKVPSFVMVNESSTDNVTGETSWEMVNKSVEIKVPLEKCDSLFSQLGWSDSVSGIVLFLSSILLLSICLYLMVKILHSLLGGQIAKAARKTINADFPRPFHWLTGYVAIIVGAGLTILVQSSSVFTSALTPLVGVGCLKLERMFPLTLGSNIGTTFTGILAALASSSSTMKVALQLAFCHLFFNITGILIFYPVPKMRKIVLGCAKYLGRTTAHYRWFAIAYLICMFILFPGFFFAISFAGKIVFIVALSLISLIAVFVVVVNIMQKSKRLEKFLPLTLRTWEFLPEFMRSLAPMDRCLQKAIEPLSKCCCQCCINRCSCLSANQNEDSGYIDSDTEDSNGCSVQSSYLPSATSSKFCLADGKIPESKKIYRPKESASRKSSLSKKSQSPLLGRRVQVEDLNTSVVSCNDESVSHSSNTSSKSNKDIGASTLVQVEDETVRKSPVSERSSFKETAPSKDSELASSSSRLSHSQEGDTEVDRASSNDIDNMRESII